MSGLVSSLVSSPSLLTAASVSETTVVGGCGSIVVGCCSIIGRYPPAERGSVRWWLRIPGACTSYAREGVSTSVRAETLVLVGTFLAQDVTKPPGDPDGFRQVRGGPSAADRRGPGPVRGTE